MVFKKLGVWTYEKIHVLQELLFSQENEYQKAKIKYRKAMPNFYVLMFFSTTRKKY